MSSIRSFIPIAASAFLLSSCGSPAPAPPQTSAPPSCALPPATTAPPTEPHAAATLVAECLFGGMREHPECFSVRRFGWDASIGPPPDRPPYLFQVYEERPVERCETGGTTVHVVAFICVAADGSARPAGSPVDPG